jgi:zinc/manganese transport system substrate-binding protein
VYLANATGLDLVSPPEFMQAVAEGNDPSAANVAAFQQQLQNKSVSLLVFNQQTVTPLTDSVKSLASQYSIPTVGVTETIQPSGTEFQVWMNAELLALENALEGSAQVNGG